MAEIFKLGLDRWMRRDWGFRDPRFVLAVMALFALIALVAAWID